MPRVRISAPLRETRRQNFNVTPEQEAELAWLKEVVNAPTTKDLFLRATRVLSALAREAQSGNALYVGKAGGYTRLLIPELETVSTPQYQYLVERPHKWRRQYYVKGRRLLASTVMREMLANHLSGPEAADNWNLPLEAVEEIIRYCESNRDLLAMEADEERCRLEEEGVALTSVPQADAA